ncbi:hypothetical protein OCO_19780 [Mycobacterium intracellulare MOTT-02]|nr:hypothetical protein OCO_19780 [Mycobacterium intracellulare MOTT-02]
MSGVFDIAVPRDGVCGHNAALKQPRQTDQQMLRATELVAVSV